jgi:hypothetical protein
MTNIAVLNFILTPPSTNYHFNKPAQKVNLITAASSRTAHHQSAAPGPQTTKTLIDSRLKEALVGGQGLTGPSFQVGLS